ncbi:MAG: DUF3263 domain-containing protein [Microbacteriaceae bacterium]|nr:DUF3263 domain-containing protein [Microbacteriaceae bacterium]
MDSNSTLNLNEPAVSDSQQAEKLSELEAKIMQFESRSYPSELVKESLIFRNFGFAPQRYYSILSSLIETEAAIEQFPVLVKSLRRLQSQRTFSRNSLFRG